MSRNIRGARPQITEHAINFWRRHLKHFFATNKYLEGINILMDSALQAGKRK